MHYASGYQKSIKLKPGTVTESDIWVVLLVDDAVGFFIEDEVNSVILVPFLSIVS